MSLETTMLTSPTNHLTGWLGTNVSMVPRNVMNISTGQQQLRCHIKTINNTFENICLQFFFLIWLLRSHSIITNLILVVPSLMRANFSDERLSYLMKGILLWWWAYFSDEGPTSLMRHPSFHKKQKTSLQQHTKKYKPMDPTKTKKYQMCGQNFWISLRTKIISKVLLNKRNNVI